MRSSLVGFLLLSETNNDDIKRWYLMHISRALMLIRQEIIIKVKDLL